MTDDTSPYPGDSPAWGHLDLTGFGVEGVDGHVGKVEEVRPGADPPTLVIRTGPPVIGRRVVMPMAMIERVDNDDQTVHLAHTRDQVETSPDA